jgi:hypothetical protein
VAHLGTLHVALGEGRQHTLGQWSPCEPQAISGCRNYARVRGNDAAKLGPPRSIDEQNSDYSDASAEKHTK